MHGINKFNVGLITVLSLLKFSRFEGKADLDGNGKPISTFEYDLFNEIYALLEKKNLSVEQTVLVWLVLTEIDSYDGSYLTVCIKTKKVINLTFRMSCYSAIQAIFFLHVT